MEKKGRWRVIALWLLVVFAVAYSLPTFVGMPDWYPFDKKLNFGLDLQGGLELRYTVDWKKAISENNRKYGDTVRSAIVEELAARDNKNVDDLPREEWDAYAKKVTIEVPEYNRLQLIFESEAVQDLLEAEKVSNTLDPRYDMYGAGDLTTELLLRDEEAAAVRENVVNETKSIITKRVEAFGLVDPDVRVAGIADIVVQIPGVGKDQMDIVRERIGQTAQLTLRMVDRQSNFISGLASKVSEHVANTPGSTLGFVPSSNTGAYIRADRKSEIINFLRGVEVPDEHVIGFEEVEIKEGNIVQEKYWRTHYLHAKAEITGDHLARSQVLYDERGAYVSLDFNSEGGRLFADLTSKNVGEYMAILLDEDVNSAPVIEEKILGGRARITMGRGSNPQAVLADARSLVTVLNHGAYKAPVYKVHDHEVGPSLGQNSVEAGQLAMALGMALVIFFMLIYYRGAGAIAVTVLLFNVLLILMLLVSFNSALTLPGMAGIILTIGMAVDANIIIFERIREELTAGRSPRAAVDAGFEKAFSTVMDANITTALAGVILLNYTSGPIRGFAVTLLMGIVCSVFTAVYVGRRIFNWYLTSKRPETLSI